MKKMKRLKSKQKCSSNQLTFYFDTSETILEPYGTETAQYKTKGEDLLENTEETATEKKKQCKPLYLMERKFIAKMIKEGLSLCQIAHELNRGKNTVIAEVRRNGGRLEYDPVKAQQIAIEKKEKKHLKCSQSTKGKMSNPFMNLNERIENIEMQLEIITETLKELNRERNKNDLGL